MSRTRRRARSGSGRRPLRAPPVKQWLRPESSSALSALSLSTGADAPATLTKVNLAATDVGGGIEEITGFVGPGFTGRRLLDGRTAPAWKRDWYSEIAAERQKEAGIFRSAGRPRGAAPTARRLADIPGGNCLFLLRPTARARRRSHDRATGGEGAAAEECRGLDLVGQRDRRIRESGGARPGRTTRGADALVSRPRGALRQAAHPVGHLRD